MLVDLPTDVLVCVGAGLRFPDLESVLATCHALRAEATEGFYLAVAIGQWGQAFWTRALTRRTPRRFAGMRGELRILCGFERELRAHGLPPWTIEDYYAFWEFEEAGGGKGKRGGALHHARQVSASRRHWTR